MPATLKGDIVVIEKYCDECGEEGVRFGVGNYTALTLGKYRFKVILDAHRATNNVQHHMCSGCFEGFMLEFIAKRGDGKWGWF